MMNILQILVVSLIITGLIAGQVVLYITIMNFKDRYNEHVDKHKRLLDLLDEYVKMQKDKTDTMIKDTENLSASVTRRTDSLAAQINDIKEKIGVGNDLA